MRLIDADKAMAEEMGEYFDYCTETKDDLKLKIARTINKSKIKMLNEQPTIDIPCGRCQHRCREWKHFEEVKSE